MSTPTLLFGTSLFSSDQGFKSAQDVEPWLDAILESKHSISGLDSAIGHRECEEYLGQLKAGSHLAISTKLPGGAHPVMAATKENVIAQARESLRILGVEHLDVLFLHAPDERVPVEDTLSGVDLLYREGAFKHFGISNHNAEQVEQIVKVCKDKGFVLPSVFQGSYSAVARLPEDELLPVLRKHNISFVAYSPIAGGFLAKTSQQFRDQSLGGRWHPAGYPGKVYQFLYNRPAALEALDRWHEIAAAEGVSSVELAYRWVAHNSALDASKGDGLVMGASSIAQWRSNLAAIRKGPLGAATARKIDALWAPLKADAVLDNFVAVKAVMMPPPEPSPQE